MTVAKEDRNYVISAPLVHKLIMSIIGGIVAIGAYMVIWALNDTEWKATITTRLEALREDVAEIKAETGEGQLNVARERLDTLEDRVRQLEESNP